MYRHIIIRERGEWRGKVGREEREREKHTHRVREEKERRVSVIIILVTVGVACLLDVHLNNGGIHYISVK